MGEGATGRDPVPGRIMRVVEIAWRPTNVHPPAAMRPVLGDPRPAGAGPGA